MHQDCLDCSCYAQKIIEQKQRNWRRMSWWTHKFLHSWGEANILPQMFWCNVLEISMRPKPTKLSWTKLLQMVGPFPNKSQFVNLGNLLYKFNFRFKGLMQHHFLGRASYYETLWNTTCSGDLTWRFGHWPIIDFQPVEAWEAKSQRFFYHQPRGQNRLLVGGNLCFNWTDSYRINMYIYIYISWHIMYIPLHHMHISGYELWWLCLYTPKIWHSWKNMIWRLLSS